MRKGERNMEMGNLLFYGGAALMAVSAVLGFVTFAVYKLRAAKLKRVLEAEYGAKKR